MEKRVFVIPYLGREQNKKIMIKIEKNKFCSICLCLYKWHNHARLKGIKLIFAISLNNG